MPSWSGRRYALHHAIVAGPPRLRSVARRRPDDPRCGRPDHAEALSHRDSSRPSAAAPVRRCRCPGAGSRVFADEGNLDDCANGIERCSVFDVRDPTSRRCDLRPCRRRRNRFTAVKGAKLGPASSAREWRGSLQTESLVLRHRIQNAGCRCSTSAIRSSPGRSGHFFRRPSDIVDLVAPTAARDPVERLLCRAGGADPSPSVMPGSNPPVQGMILGDHTRRPETWPAL